MRRMYSASCQWDVSPSGWAKFWIWDPPSRYFLYLLVWGMAKNKRSNHRKICSCSMVLFKCYKQSVAPDFLKIICRTIQVQWNLDIVWQKNARRNAKEVGAVRGEAVADNPNHGGKKQSQVWLSGTHESHWTSCQGKHFTVHYTYTVKRKVGAGLKPIRVGKGLKTKDDKGIWSLLC